jgi:hypothetical protein
LRQNGLNRLARRALQSRDLSRELNGVSRCHDTCSALFKFCGTGVTPNDRVARCATVDRRHARIRDGASSVVGIGP